MTAKLSAADKVAHQSATEFYGICMGIVSDGSINTSEAEFMLNWLTPRIHSINDPMISKVYDTLEKIEKEGFTEQNESLLIEVVMAYTGGQSTTPDSQLPTTIPLCQPAPELNIPGKTFCFTGTFDYGTRQQCQKAITDNGGSVAKDVTTSVDFVIIGNNITPEWKHQSYGKKILKAMQYRDKYGTPAIASENHWLKFIPRNRK